MARGVHLWSGAVEFSKETRMETSLEVKAPGERAHGAAGIVIKDQMEPVTRPVIAAFIWGGKVRPSPTLPFGRWKQSAA